VCVCVCVCVSMSVNGQLITDCRTRYYQKLFPLILFLDSAVIRLWPHL